MQKNWICLFLISGLAGSCMAQSLINSGAVLATARQDLAVDLQGRQLEFMQQTNRGLPFLEQISLRTETDRFELRRQEYLTRFSANGFRKMNRQRQLQQSDRQLEESRHRIYLHQALLIRYQLLIEYYQTQRKLALQQSLHLVYDDQMKVQQTLAALNAGAEVSDLVEAEFDRDELALKIAESEAKLGQIRATVQAFLPAGSGEWQLDTAGFIPPGQIEHIAAEIPQTVLQNPEAAEKQAKIGLVSAEFDLEKAKSRQILDFFQVRYGNRPEAAFNRDFSVGAGFNLPYRGSAGVKMAELKIEKNAAGQEWQIYLSKLAGQVADTRLKLEALGRRYRQAQQQWLESQARYTLDQAGAGPVTLLKTRELQLKRQFLLLEMESEMFTQYLNLLDSTGALSATPAVNYLSAALPAF